jgi:hypothetical protein
VKWSLYVHIRELVYVRIHYGQLCDIALFSGSHVHVSMLVLSWRMTIHEKGPLLPEHAGTCVVFVSAAASLFSAYLLLNFQIHTAIIQDAALHFEIYDMFFQTCRMKLGQILP